MPIRYSGRIGLAQGFLEGQSDADDSKSREIVGTKSGSPWSRPVRSHESARSRPISSAIASPMLRRKKFLFQLIDNSYDKRNENKQCLDARDSTTFTCLDNQRGNRFPRRGSSPSSSSLSNGSAVSRPRDGNFLCRDLAGQDSALRR